MGDSWGQPRGPSAQQVARSMRLRCADDLAWAVTNWRRNPIQTNENIMVQRANEYLAAKEQDEHEQ